MKFDFFTADNAEVPCVRIYDVKSGNTVIDVYILDNDISVAQLLAEGIVMILNNGPKLG